MPVRWTEQEYQLLRACYPIGGAQYTHQVFKENGFNRTSGAIKNKAVLLGVRSISDGKFKKGHMPQNKGLGMSDELREKVKHTWYKKGHLPHNTKEKDGKIVKRKDNRGVLNYHIRVSLGKWKYLSRYLWEQAHGPIPKGMVVTFKDGDPMNCVLENIEMISRLENLKRRQKESGGHCATQLTDGYVRGVLKRRGIHPDAITPDMIETKKLQLILNRQIKKNESSDK